MPPTSAIILAITIVLFVLKFSIGFNADLKKLLYFRGRPSLLIRSLLADIILVPCFAIGLILLFDLPKAVNIALLLLAASPGAPLASIKAYKVQGNFSYGLSLQLLLSLLAIVTVPAWLLVYDQVFDIGARAFPLMVARQLGFAVLLPLALGLAARQLLPKLARRYARPFAEWANRFLLLLGFALLIVFYRLITGSEWGVYTVFAAFLLAALVTGHLLGGPQPENRTTLATMTSTRNLGIALFIAAQNFEQPAVMAMVMPYLLMAIVVSLGYGQWRKRAVRTRAAAGP